MLRYFPSMGGRRNGVFQVTCSGAKQPSWQETSRRDWLYRVISTCLNSIPPRRTNSSTNARSLANHSKCYAAANNGTTRSHAASTNPSLFCPQCIKLAKHLGPLGGRHEAVPRELCPVVLNHDGNGRLIQSHVDGRNPSVPRSEGISWTVDVPK